MSNPHLYSTYQRIKKAHCCEEWEKDSRSFYGWYQEQADKQKKCCAYCGLPGDTKEYYYRHFRPDKNGHCRRGLALEVEKNNNEPYSPSNCVLACYPCNNAKSDVFFYDEFVEIGRAIGKVKRRKRLT